MNSFFASLVNGTEKPHLYRVFLDGDDREFHLLRNPQGQEIISATPDGTPSGLMRLSLATGKLEPSDSDGGYEREDDGISREEFSRVSVHIRAQWLRSGSPPARVSKVFA
ncbi:hypothetical protein RM780_22815 [Streptomyces sp. DSM 44917]|uniref:Uncharacterized protein n=1 Tax=Streptomyces boetiae TaxID=3075541 RepID=A0ABU2LDY1_9ACTN|nr:hypothetical protein [Streptomyces sp. DSM 44917]MDT0309766.1 hypothetical protein [Streptomyces sp. DSM 44917]